MPSVKLHQDVYGGKAGQTVSLTEDQATFALSQGYASQEGHSGELEAGDPVVGYDADHDQTNADAREDDAGLGERAPLADAGVATESEPVRTSEAYDPSEHTVNEVNEYLDSGVHDVEVRRVVGLEKRDKGRSGVLNRQGDGSDVATS